MLEKCGQQAKKSAKIGEKNVESVNCHICHMPFEENDTKILCYCKQIVHNDCHKTDGDSCPFFQK